MNAPEVLEQLSGRLEELERRVSQLERHWMVAASAANRASQLQMPAEKALAPELANGLPAMGPVVTVAGIALLGIAGAYVLRALAGAVALPRPLLGLLGAAYATAWAVAGVRASRRLAQGVYAVASVVILAPMLWEMCLRFRAMSPLAAALVLCSYLVIGCVNVRPAFDQPAFSILYAGSALAALTLCIATRSMMPFVTILLAMVAFEEFRRMRGEALPAGPLVWLSVDIAAWAMLVVYRVPPAARPEYPQLSAATVLAGPVLVFLLHTTAITHESCIRRRKIAVLHGMQWLVAFALMVLGLFWMAGSRSVWVVGALCFVLCAGCYWAAFSRDWGEVPNVRVNFRVFATWAFLLLIAGQLLLLPAGVAAVGLGSAATLAMVAAQRMQSITLQVHSLGFVLVGAFACGLPAYIWRAMVTDAAARPTWSIVAMTMIMVVTYAVCGERKAETDFAQAVHFALALTAAGAVGAIFTHLVLMTAALVVRPETFHVALVRTVALCVLMLVIVVAGTRLERVSLSRVAYILLGVVAIKLVFEDLRHGHFGYLAASIGIVAGTLIAMPRLSGRIGAMRP